MVKDGLISRSPVRVFENAINGGLHAGEIGLIAAAAGIGKTSVLVQIALDKLLQGKKVIHISFTQDHDYVVAWYEDIFDQFIKRKNVENERELKEEIIRNRMLLNFNQEGVTTDIIRKSLKAMIIEGGYKAEAIIIDGFDFSIANRERIATLKEFAKELGFYVWYSCSVKDGNYDKKNIPNEIKDFEDCIDVVIDLEAKGDCVSLYLVKNHGKYLHEYEPLRLDPKTLLILE
ncbi:MAG: hypothetical protein LBV68_05585 [Spirochaetaceae bacterium]|jgi:KaiC/GvpD/RAD55 family RecA-like ATPase|nr:hypothetical protein [Spirochaetaceae bacterium]